MYFVKNILFLKVSGQTDFRFEISVIFPQHLCWGSPFLLPLSVSRLIAGIKLFIPSVPPGRRCCCYYRYCCCYTRLNQRRHRECIFEAPKTKYMTLGPKFFFSHKMTTARRPMTFLKSETWKRKLGSRSTIWQCKTRFKAILKMSKFWFRSLGQRWYVFCRRRAT